MSFLDLRLFTVCRWMTSLYALFDCNANAKHCSKQHMSDGYAA